MNDEWIFTVSLTTPVNTFLLWLMYGNTYLLCAWRCVRRAASVLCGQPPCWQWRRSQWWARLMTLYAQPVPVLARSYALRIPRALSSYPPDVVSQGHRRTCWHLEGKEETLSLFMVFTFILTVNIFPLHQHTHPAFTTQFHQQCHCSWKYSCGQTFWQRHKGLLEHFAACSFWMIKSLWLFFSLS